VELLSTLLVQHGTDAQRARWLGPLLTAQKRGAYCITEAEAGTDVSGIRSTAVKDGDGWVLNGGKIWIHNAPVADVGFVLARTDPEAGHRGMSIFIVDLHAEGVSRGPKEHKMGQRASQVGALNFDNVRLPAEALLGVEGRGFHMMMSVLDKGRVGIAALAVGIGQAGLEAAVDYAAQRKQFGQPIAGFQGVSFQVADMVTEIDASDLLTLMGAWRLDQGLPANREIASAKVHASEMLAKVTDTTLQIFGGMGLMDDFPIERFWRDARVERIWDGTSEIQRHIISREIFRPLGA